VSKRQQKRLGKGWRKIIEEQKEYDKKHGIRHKKEKKE
jgi:hypothetical protein